ARPRTEDSATAFPARLSGRAMPGPAGAFLAVGLGAAARNRGAGLGAGGALACVGELAHVGLVHDRHVRRLGEDGLRQIDLAVALAYSVEERDLQRVRLRRFLCLLGSGLF